MRRSHACIIVMATVCLPVLALRCAPFTGADPPPLDGGGKTNTNDGSVATDGGVARDGSASGENDGGEVVIDPSDSGVVEGGVPIFDAGLPGALCFDLKASKGPFTLKDNAKHVPNSGIELPITQGAGASAVSSFSLPSGSIERSDVYLDLSATTSGGNFGDSNGDYIDTVTQYYGPQQVAYYQGCAFNAIELVKGGDLDVNIWNRTGDNYSGSFPAAAPLTGNGSSTILLSTTWTSQGPLSVTIGQSPRQDIHTNIAQKTDQKTVTLVLGGSAGGTHPSVTMTVRMVCVGLHAL